MTAIICENCRFFVPDKPEPTVFGKPKTTEWGSCWRFPPTPVGAGSVSSQGVNGFARSCRPEVKQSHFCGEFILRGNA